MCRHKHAHMLLSLRLDNAVSSCMSVWIYIINTSYAFGGVPNQTE